MKLEQWVMIGAEVTRHALLDGGVVEHSAQRYSIDISSLYSEADDPASELIHHDEYPVRLQHDGFTAKEINAPKAILYVTKEGQPRRASDSRRRSIVFGEHPADHVLVDLDAEGPRNDERDLRTTEPWIALLELDDRSDKLGDGPLGPGLPCLCDEKSRRYLLFFRAS